MKKIKNRVGQKFQQLTVVKFSHTDKHHHTHWVCQCDCGTIKTLRLVNLQQGTKSCGCDKNFNLKNQVFERITVLDFSHKYQSFLYWKCKCSCGNTKIIRGADLKAGKTKSCGCYNFSKELQEKRKQTCLKKYGVPYAIQNTEIRLKAAKSCNNIVTLQHWQTKKDVFCQGSYEEAVVRWLNEHKIDFIWQPKTFTMSDGKTYTPDCLLINENKWIEVKGFFRKDAKRKWDWFHTQHPNSELWDTQALQSMDII